MYVEINPQLKLDTPIQARCKVCRVEVWGLFAESPEHGLIFVDILQTPRIPGATPDRHLQLGQLVDIEIIGRPPPDRGYWLGRLYNYPKCESA